MYTRVAVGTGMICPLLGIQPTDRLQITLTYVKSIHQLPKTIASSLPIVPLSILYCLELDMMHCRRFVTVWSHQVNVALESLRLSKSHVCLDAFPSYQ